MAQAQTRKAPVYGAFRYIWLLMKLLSGAGSRTRTGTALPPRDFKSLVSTCSTIPAEKTCLHNMVFYCCPPGLLYQPLLHSGQLCHCFTRTANCIQKALLFQSLAFSMHSNLPYNLFFIKAGCQINKRGADMHYSCKSNWRGPPHIKTGLV